MNTEQNYVGRGNYATPAQTTAPIAAQTPLTSDGWQSVQPDIYKAQSDLLMLVDSYMEYTNPIVAINEILERWLTAGADEMSDEYYKHHLVAALRLITFLTELRDSHRKLTDIYEGREKEVSNG